MSSDRTDGSSKIAHWPVNVGVQCACGVYMAKPSRSCGRREGTGPSRPGSRRRKGVQAPHSHRAIGRTTACRVGRGSMRRSAGSNRPRGERSRCRKRFEPVLFSEAPARARIAEAERLLIDRCCRDGGWNFGNANVMGQDLFPHVPTTALALLALQGRREEPAVTRSLAFLESHWSDEPSPLALGLSLICLRTYGRPVEAIEARTAGG